MKITRYMIIMVSTFFFVFGMGNKVEAYEETKKYILFPYMAAQMLFYWKVMDIMEW